MATKAKAKAKAKPAAKKAAGKSNRWANTQLPKGFQPITSGEYGQPWDHEAMPLLQGVVSGELRTVEQGKGKDKRETRVATIETDEGCFDVWESASLSGFFDKLSDGMSVAVAFQGYRDTGKASPMKVIVGAIHEDDIVDEAPKRRKKK